MELGERIERARTARGFKNLSAFARSIGVPVSSLHDIKQGTMPRPERLELICRALGIDPAVFVYGSDEAFEAALRNEGELLPARTFRLDSGVEEDGAVTGPSAWKHFDSNGHPADALDHGRGMRSGTEGPVRVVSLPGVPFGHDVFEAKIPKMMPIIIDGEARDMLHPCEILITDPTAKARDGDLVIGKREASDVERSDDIWLWRFHKHGRVEMLIPLNEDPDRAEKASGWDVVGVVVERRRLR